MGLTEVIFIVIVIFGLGVPIFIDSISLSEREECLLEIAEKVCEENGMFLKERADNSIPLRVFNCIESERRAQGEQFLYLEEERKGCIK